MTHRTIGVGAYHATPRTYELINQVLDTGRLSYGPLSRQLERDFAALHDRKYGILSNSGTSSLQVALQAMKELHEWEDGSKVAIPATTFVATCNVVLHNRLTPVLVDIEPDTYGMDVQGLYRADRNADLAAAIPVHLFGHPCRHIDSIADFCNSSFISLIEDSCECMFAQARYKSVGSWGDIACFSFYMAHLITAGVGGVSITNDPDLATKMRSLVNHGRDGVYISIDDDKEFSAEQVSRRFNFESIGHSYRITELEAAIALAQLEDWETMIAKRQANAAALTDLLMDYVDRIQLPTTLPSFTHSFMMYPIVLREGDKWPLINHLERHNIETRELLPLVNQPCYKGMWNPDDYPVSQWLIRGGFYVGCHQDLDATNIEYMAETIISWLKTN